jgi:hypothetical protein
MAQNKFIQAPPNPPSRKNLAFEPFRADREYFNGLGASFTEERGLKAHATQREIFHRLVELARAGEAVMKSEAGPSSQPSTKIRSKVA